MKALSQFFKVLADESRLEILFYLFNSDELCVCDLTELLQMTQSKASRHLATLRHAGLVQDRREAVWSYYSLASVADPTKADFLELLRHYLNAQPSAEQRRERLKAWLREKATRPSCKVTSAETAHLG